MRGIGARLRLLLRLVGLLTLCIGQSSCMTTLPKIAPVHKATRRTPTMPAAVTVQQRVLSTPTPACTGTFVAHDLDHSTVVAGETVQMFEGNGTGVAINDLDDDGDLDLVLANRHGANTIFWNEGRLQFRPERFGRGATRAINVVDVDGDNHLDLVFTRGNSGPNYWRNTGMKQDNERWEQTILDGVAKPAYSMAWDDTDGDGDLDLVAGSYDAELLNVGGNNFLFGDGAGVYAYENRGDHWAGTRLAQKSQALALALFDVNADGHRDLLAGNDFATPDQTWARRGGAWIEAAPFSQISHSPMSYDWGDIDNNGSFELFATDMKPYTFNLQTLAQWRPMMEKMWHPTPFGDPQIMENTLQISQNDGTFRNEAYSRGIDATGWSWSGKFGDLDNDGFLDLYVVNGMIEAELFAYLPNQELVEQNQALRNDGSGRFVPVPQWKLGSERSGRGMSMADLDSDGDLDIVVNNIRGAAQLFENRLCGGTSIELDLRWPQSKNTRAIGATLILDTDAGRFSRDVRAGSGYLSGDPARVHFGIPAHATIRHLDIHWPDGAVTSLDKLSPHVLITVTRT